MRVKISSRLYRRKIYMKIEKYNNNRSLFPSFDKLDDFMRLFNHPFFTDSSTNLNSLALSADIYESDKQFNIVLEVPGLIKEDIKIAYDGSNRFLSITAASAYEKLDKPNFHIRERRIGSNTRQFRIPSNVDTAQLSSKIEDGVLRITAPLMTEKSDIIDIEVN